MKFWCCVVTDKLAWLMLFCVSGSAVSDLWTILTPVVVIGSSLGLCGLNSPWALVIESAFLDAMVEDYRAW